MKSIPCIITCCVCCSRDVLCLSQNLSLVASHPWHACIAKWQLSAALLCPPLSCQLSKTRLLCRLTKFAASSLGFEDIPAAVKYLTDALKLLTQPM